MSWSNPPERNIHDDDALMTRFRSAIISQTAMLGMPEKGGNELAALLTVPMDDGSHLVAAREFLKMSPTDQLAAMQETITRAMGLHDFEPLTPQEFARITGRIGMLLASEDKLGKQGGMLIVTMLVRLWDQVRRGHCDSKNLVSLTASLNQLAAIPYSDAAEAQMTEILEEFRKTGKMPTT